jgi:polar amino acid transport system substrate-binding protein
MHQQVKILAICCKLLISLLASTNLQAETLSYIAYEPPNPPYFFEKNSHYIGIHGEILNAIGKITGDTFVEKRFPVARALKMFDAGLVDIEPGINPKWRDKSPVNAVYSKPLIDQVDVVIFKPTAAINLTNPEQLFGKKVGIVRGYSYPNYDTYFENQQIIRVNNVSEKLLLKQLRYGELDQIFIDLQTFLFEQQQHPDYQQLVVGNVINITPIMTRIHPKKAHVLPRINAAIEQLQHNGDIKRIYQKYAHLVIKTPPTTLKP